MKRLLYFILFFLTCWVHAQLVQQVDFLHADCHIRIDPYTQTVNGRVTYEFLVTARTDSIFIDARNTTFNRVLLDDKPVAYHNTGKRLWVKHSFTPGNKHLISFSYKANPEKAMYFIGWAEEDGLKQVWTQGQGKYTSNWLPSFDDMREKVEFDLTLTFDKEYQVIANGKLLKAVEEGGLKTWYYDMENPMSSYLVALAIGAYHNIERVSDRGIPIMLFYYPGDSLKREPTYRYSGKIFDFLEKEIGVGYPWQNYKQIPVKDFLYAGMENTSATIFSDAFVIDSVAFKDRNYVNVNAHELAHQWFGDLVTEESGKHHWLHEGFATYYAWLAEKEIFGEDYYYNRLYESAQRLIQRSDAGNGERLLDPKASSLTFYQKGALALHILREQVGDTVFRKSVINYLNKNRYKNAEVSDFISEVEKEGELPLDIYVNTWLNSDIFPKEVMLNSLARHAKIRALMDWEKQGIHAFFKTDKHMLDTLMLNRIFESPDSELLTREVLSAIKKSLPKPDLEYVYRKALSAKNIKTRQEVILQADSIPAALQGDFEQLLSDASYVTVEYALFKLWLQFPERRTYYLNSTEQIHGFNNKNIRTLWLALALVTPTYRTAEKEAYLKELSGYTSPVFHFEIRQNAFMYLRQIQVFSDQNLKDLVSACTHPVWQFSKYARQLLEQLLSKEEYKLRYQQFFSELSKEEQTFLSKYLN